MTGTAAVSPALRACRGLGLGGDVATLDHAMQRAAGLAFVHAAVGDEFREAYRLKADGHGQQAPLRHAQPEVGQVAARHIRLGRIGQPDQLKGQEVPDMQMAAAADIGPGIAGLILRALVLTLDLALVFTLVLAATGETPVIPSSRPFYRCFLEEAGNGPRLKLEPGSCATIARHS